MPLLVRNDLELGSKIVMKLHSDTFPVALVALPRALSRV